MSYPSQTQLRWPLLDTLHAFGDPVLPADVYAALAAQHQLDPAAQAATTPTGARAWDRHVRWTEQQTRRRGWTAHPTRGRWGLTDRGRALLRVAEPGTVTVVFRRPDGQILWADSLPVLRGLAPGSVDLVLTSPPYALRRAKAYGGPRDAAAWIAWFLPFAEAIHRALRDTGSLVLNLGLGPYEPGVPVRSPVIHRLVLALLDTIGFHLAGEHVWVNPAALPAPAEWVTKQRRQVKDGYELVLWFSRTPWPKADNRRVLQPYSAAQRAVQARGWTAQRRPSGHALTGDFAADRGGSIPSRVLVAAPTASNDPYLRFCRAHGLPPHPARFPEALPDWWIRFLTEPGDLVVDPFAGSCTTAAVAARLGRRWLAVEQAKTYLDGGLSRFA